MILFTTLINNIDANAFYYDKNNNKPKKINLVDAWATPFPGHGIQSSEYSVPIDKCKNAMVTIQNELSNNHIFAFVLRFLKAEKWNMAFAPVESCIIDFGFCDLGTRHFEKEQFNFYKTIESVIQQFGGKPHFGKVIVSKWPNIFPDNFKNLRNIVDPHKKFTNNYLDQLLEETDVQTWNDRYESAAITKRKKVWIFFSILSFNMATLLIIYNLVLCFTLKRVQTVLRHLFNASNRFCVCTFDMLIKCSQMKKTKKVQDNSAELKPLVFSKTKKKKKLIINVL
jgi:hypothetical protein